MNQVNPPRVRSDRTSPNHSLLPLFSLSLPRSTRSPFRLCRRRPIPACSGQLRRRARAQSRALSTLYNRLPFDLLFSDGCDHAQLNPRVRFSVTTPLRRASPSPSCFAMAWCRAPLPVSTPRFLSFSTDAVMLDLSLVRFRLQCDSSCSRLSFCFAAGVELASVPSWCWVVLLWCDSSLGPPS